MFLSSYITPLGYDRTPQKTSRRLDRIVRFGALLLLCGLVWYFSYDHGRTDSKRRVDKVELENIALREKLILAEEDIKVLKDELAALRKAQAENPEPARQEAVEKPTLEAGQKAVQDANLARPDQVDSDVSGSDGVGLGLTGLTSEAPGELATEEVTESVPEPVPEAESEVALRPADDQARGRLTLRAMENKAAFGNEVVLSLVDLNSIDLEITLRIRYAKSGRREAHLMSPGDLIEIKIDDTLHTIYLDQIRGNMAFFILDGLPKEPTT